MPDQVHLTINGRAVTVAVGTSLAAAIARAGVTRFRRSLTGEPRSVLCGMGVCMECRVTINGQTHCRSCQVLCQPGMEILTDA